MNGPRTSLRSLLLLVALGAALITSLQSASARHLAVHKPGIATPIAPKGNPPAIRAPGWQKLNDPSTERASFFGQIVGVIGPATNPNGFVLQLGNTVVTIHLMAKTMISGKSAEADVEGLVRGDYVTVNARRVNGNWYATRVVYDVQPIFPYRLLSGTIVRLSVDGRRIVVRPATGKGTFVVRISAQTRYLQDGHPAILPPILQSGNVIDVLARRAGAVWVAYDLDVRTTS